MLYVCYILSDSNIIKITGIRADYFDRERRSCKDFTPIINSINNIKTIQYFDIQLFIFPNFITCINDYLLYDSKLRCICASYDYKKSHELNIKNKNETLIAIHNKINFTEIIVKILDLK